MEDKINTYYIYMYLDQDNVPFYIGKGKDYRYHISCHLNKSNFNCFLQNKIRKVGVNNVKIHFLHKDLTEEQSFYLEGYYIAGYGRRDLGLGSLCNLTNGGEGESGRIVSESTRQKISKIHKGKKIPQEVVERQRQSVKEYYESHNNPFLGKTHSEKTRKRMGASAKGKVLSDETRKKLSEALKGRPAWNKGVTGCFKGKHHTEESKRKMSEAAQGRTVSEETRRKISEASKGRFIGEKNPMYGKPAWNKGKSTSEETKEKLRIAALKYREEVFK